VLSNQSSKFLKVAVAVAAFVSQAAFATPVNFSGELTTTDPVYNRPFTTTSLSSTGTHASYDVYGFHVSANGTYSIEATAFNATGAGLASDTFFALYQNTFNPASGLTNLLQVDDDSGVGALSLLNSTLTAGTQYYLIFTTFDNGRFGTYSGLFNTLTGAGQVSLDGATIPGQVPEPGNMALVSLALLGMGVAGRRNRR
jgi:hypothetical protein